MTKPFLGPLGSKRRRWALGLSAVAVLIFVFDLGFFAATLMPESKIPEEIPVVDVIAVLTGGRGRLREAARILEDNRGSVLFISGVEPGTRLDQILAGNRVEGLSAELRQRILLGNDSTSTQENATEVRGIVARSKARSVLLVTSNYHIRRAKMYLEREFQRFPALEVTVHTYPVESPNFGQDRWYRSLTGWRILVTEYFKFLPLRFS